MSNIEVILCLLLLFMTVPDLCRRLRRPALAYAVFVLFGVFLSLLGDYVPEAVATVFEEAGTIGFMLLLFEVGLEADIPKWREFLKPLKFAAPWVMIQYPLIFSLAYLAGLDILQSLTAATALTGCSVGMAHAAWKEYPGLNEPQRQPMLRILVTLEILAIILLAMESIALEKGLSWMILVNLAGIVLAIYLVGRFAVHLTQLFQRILSRATHWRTHLLVLMVLLVGAVGQRLGLSAPKTAFFLGLFMSRAQHDGKGLEEFIAPISRRFLIPLFFVSLGMIVKWEMLTSWMAPLAAGTAVSLLLLRGLMNRGRLRVSGDKWAFLLLCPNLTVVALGVRAMSEATRGQSNAQAGWLLLTGLFVTVTSIFMLPKVAGAGTTKQAPLA